MDGRAMDELARVMNGSRTRRGMLGLLLGGALSVSAAAPVLVDAKSKGKHKNKKNRDKKNDSRANNAVCKTGETACGPVCCPNGQICGDMLNGLCYADGQVVTQ